MNKTTLPAIMYHLTTRADFKLDPKARPQNNSTLGGDWEPGVFLGLSVEHWVNGFGYWRPWVVEFDTSALLHEDIVFSEGGESLVSASAYPRLLIKRVVPLDAHCREQFGECGWTEQFFETDFRTGLPISCAPGGQRGYHYAGDARQEPADWRKAYARRVKRYAVKSGRGSQQHAG